MSRTAERNDRVIRGAFARLQRNKHAALLSGLQELCRQAVFMALSLHNPEDKHLHARQSYAYAIYHNGKLVDYYECMEDGRFEGNVDMLIDQYAPRSKGYDAVIVADMSIMGLNVTKERDILTMTAQDVKQNFWRYFKPIA